jgi:hypothetical protein
VQLQEVLLASILRELVGLRDDRVRAVMERDQHRQTAALRKSDELFHTLCDMMQIEDWEGQRRDRCAFHAPHPLPACVAWVDKVVVLL